GARAEGEGETAARVRDFGESGYADAEFDRLAREVFARQYEACAPYRALCDRRGRGPSRVAHWSEIPAVPQAAFKSATLYSDEAAAGRVFETSGTTVGRSGRHYVSERGHAPYPDSRWTPFAHFLLPDRDQRPGPPPPPLALP